jgi:hypothetical protein
MEEIVERSLILREEERLMIPESRITIESIDISTTLGSFLFIVSLELDSCLLGEDSYRLTELDLLDLHQEIDRTTSLATGETMGNIFLWGYDEWWRLLLMKRAESLVVDSCLLGLDISVDDIQDLDAGFDILGERQKEWKVKSE